MADITEEAPTTTRPLAGWSVVVTRSEGQADRLSEQLQQAGAEPVAYPTIAFAPPDDLAPLDSALQRLLAGDYAWLVLTSATGARAIYERLTARQDGAPPQALPDLNLAAVGAATARACSKLFGREPTIVPDTFVAESLADMLTTETNVQGQRILLAQAELARPVLRERLQQAGALVDTVVAYRTVPASGGADVPAMLAAGEIHAITFTSGTTVRYFVQRIGPELLPYARQTVIACIGPVTADAAREAGLPPVIVADTSTVEGLIEALAHWRQQQKAG